MGNDTPKRIGIRRSPDLNRAVYQRFLESDYPEALRLAECVLAANPADAVALAVRDQCVLALKRETVRPKYESESEAEDDTTEELVEELVPGPDEPTGPTLSLAKGEDAARELYRLYLASEYAPALALAEELMDRDC